ncbi:hypothetical protein C5E45_28710 [Nocardia nova]|uniref:DUF5642 domain-containing protein n=1 Tax=Nocardia nova TaxID=37330 RepID=A0A2S6AHW5_9NOCA|nr:DUF5642 family protein [Nocardia nova]PPJ23485.1 hypothetical protein C5E41_24375 [Nocardia nova]PPJ34816.1 hypothetical protein C5E45_28710 [Nocardia nova]
MSVPDPSASRRRRGFGRTVGYAALSCLLSACGSTVSGHPTAMHQSAVTRHVDGDLTAMLPGQDRFPAGYTTVVASGDRAAAAAADLSAIPPGARIDPPDCAPDPLDPGRIAVVVGTDDRTRATITVVLSRTNEPLSRLGDQLSRCATVHARHAAIDRTITTRLLPPPPVDADDTVAFGRTVTGSPPGSSADPALRTLFAQVGDIRIETTAMTFGADAPDTTGLDQVFTAAVAKVRTR